MIYNRVLLPERNMVQTRLLNEPDLSRLDVRDLTDALGFIRIKKYGRAKGKTRRVLKRGADTLSDESVRDLGKAIEFLNKDKYGRVTSSINRVLKRNERNTKEDQGIDFGPWIQEFLTSIWSSIERTQAIEDAGNIGCDAFAFCALPLWDLHAVDEMFEDRDLSKIKPAGINLHKNICQEILDAGMSPVIYGLHFAQIRGEGIVGINWNGVLITQDEWMGWSGNARKGWTHAFDQVLRAMPDGIIVVDGVEPYSNQLQPSPPLNQYATDMHGIFQGVHYHLGQQGPYSGGNIEIHVNAGNENEVSNRSKGGIMSTDGGWGYGYRNVWSGRHFACIPDGDINEVTSWVRTLHQNSKDRDSRSLLLIIHTTAWEVAGPGYENQLPLYKKLDVEPFGAIYRVLANRVTKSRDVIDIQKLRLVGTRPSEDIRSWPVTHELRVTAFRETNQKWTSAPNWPSNMILGGPAQGNLWIIRDMGGHYEGAAVEWFLPGQTTQYMTAEHIGSMSGAWGAWVPRVGESFFFCLTTPNWVGELGKTKERSNIVKVVWGF